MGIHRYVHFRLPGRDHPALQLRSRITGLHRTGTGPDMVYYLHHRRKRFKQLDKASRFIHGKGAWMALFSFLPVIGDAILIVLGLMRAHIGIVTVSMTLGKLARYVLLVAAALGLIHLF